MSPKIEGYCIVGLSTKTCLAYPTSKNYNLCHCSIIPHTVNSTIDCNSSTNPSYACSAFQVTVPYFCQLPVLFLLWIDSLLYQFPWGRSQDYCLEAKWHSQDCVRMMPGTLTCPPMTSEFWNSHPQCSLESKWKGHFYVILKTANLKNPLLMYLFRHYSKGSFYHLTYILKCLYMFLSRGHRSAWV